MKPTVLKLPSNRKFGLFFSIIFLLMAIYSYFNLNLTLLFYLLVAFFLSFFMCSLFKPDWLFPLNKLWMQLGLILGFLINPIILAFIFFIIFSPYGLLLRLFGRDQLRLRKINDKTNWKLRPKTTLKIDFKEQF